MNRPKLWLWLRPTSAIVVNFGSASAKILKFAKITAEVYVSFLKIKFFNLLININKFMRYYYVNVLQILFPQHDTVKLESMFK